jgi:predicted AAA+ superfamily ATPase
MAAAGAGTVPLTKEGQLAYMEAKAKELASRPFHVLIYGNRRTGRSTVAWSLAAAGGIHAAEVMEYTVDAISADKVKAQFEFIKASGKKALYVTCSGVPNKDVIELFYQTIFLTRKW